MKFCPFKKFKDALGIPGKGIHSYRILDTAIVDYAMTLIVAFLTAYFLHVPLVLSTIVWFISGTILHMLFGIETNTLQRLGISC